MTNFFKSILVVAVLTAGQAQAVQLVSDETIKVQKQLTTTHKLKNGIPVIVRESPGSDILHVNVTFAAGIKDLKLEERVLNDWMWTSLPMSAKGYPKAKVYELTEKYALDLGCAGGVEISACSLGTLNDQWSAALPLFATLIKEPSFADADLKLTKERLEATLRNTPSDPGKYVNEVVNSIFYPKGHPYRLNHDEAMASLVKLKRADVVNLHKRVVSSELMSIVVVTSMPAAQVVKDLDGAFGTVKTGKFQHVTPTPPAFAPSDAYTFSGRDIPTAYIRIKLNGPGIKDKDATAARLLYEILSEELGEEIRTKRSLSYAVGSFLLQYELGVGVISASTSKPKETIEAIHDVLTKMKSKVFTKEEIEEYKNSFATGYYLTQETHASLAGAIAGSVHYFQSADKLYQMPRELDAVTPDDIKRLASDLLVNLRVGVIFNRAGFQDAWAKELIRKHAAPGRT
jgi:zinc protease